VTETADLEQNPIIAKIRNWRPEAVAGLISFRGELTVNVYREHIRPLSEFMKSDPDLAFTYLSDVTGVDRFPIEPRFELDYHLLSISRRDEGTVCGSNPTGACTLVAGCRSRTSLVGAGSLNGNSYCQKTLRTEGTRRRPPESLTRAWHLARTSLS